MSCGKVKSETPGRAIDVYLGPSFRMVKKYLKGNNHLDVKVLSAKYGVIDYRDQIASYDLKMNKKASLVYKEAFEKDFVNWSNKYDDVFILGGSHYQNVIPVGFEAIRAKGKMGQQLSQLKEWLNDIR